MFGYIPVLPGAFSMYRWMAIRGEPLAQYFTIGEPCRAVSSRCAAHAPPPGFVTAEEKPINELGPAMSNMYLAEDRILCFEILARKHRQWLLRYVPGAVADTDTPQTLVELIKQRRRWLNGSLFALFYYLVHFSRFLQTSHSCGRKFLLIIQFFFNLTVALLSWFTLASMFLGFL